MKLVVGDADVDDVDAFVGRLDGIGEANGCAVAALDARYVAGRRHLEAAVERANRAFRRDDAIAEDRAIEILLYAAGRRQIDRALEVGVGEGRGPAVVVVDSALEATGDEDGAADAVADVLDSAEVFDGPETGDGPGAERDEALIRDFFGITDAELGATEASLEDLVVERVSLLAVEK